MPVNRGKQFEAKVKEDMQKIEGISVDRIYDQVSGYATISNISDFVCYRYPTLIYLEAKSIHGNTFPLGNLTQLEKLKCKMGIKGVKAGVVIWYVDHDIVIWCPVESFLRIKEEGFKSINIRTLDLDEYKIKKLPSVKRRVFLDTDYKELFEVDDE